MWAAFYPDSSIHVLHKTQTIRILQRYNFCQFTKGQPTFPLGFAVQVNLLQTVYLHDWWLEAGIFIEIWKSYNDYIDIS